MDNNTLYNWLYIPPNVYVREIEDKGFFLYDTQTGVFLITSDTELCAVVKDVYEPKNLGVIKYEQKSLISNDFTKAVEKGLVKIIPIKDEKIKPVNFLPILNLQNDFSKYDNPDEAPHLRKNVTRFLSALNIYLSYSNNLYDAEEKSFTENASKQVLLASSGNPEQYIELKVLENIFLQAAHSSTKKINFIPGNNYFQKVKQNDFFQLLSGFDFEYHIHLSVNDFVILQQNSKFKKLEVFYNLYIDKFTTEEKIKQIPSLCFGDKCLIHCLITSEKEYIFYKNNKILYESFNNINYIPILTSENHEFFEKNVFLTTDDLSANPVSMHEIFRNRKLNANFFGILSVLPDKSVFAHGGDVKLGNITNTSLTELVYNELKRNSSWRKTRDLTPCKNCFFCYLCPPVSIYETVSNNYKICKNEI